MTWLESLAKHENVAKVEKVGNLIIITTKDSRPDLILLENPRLKLSGDYLKTLLNTYQFNFLLCYKKNYFLDESAIGLLNINNISYGDAKDVFRLLNSKEKNYHDFINKDSEYVLKNLGNNFNVLCHILQSNRKISVLRHDGRPLNFVFINDYEITQARIDEVYELYSPFDFILAANPNARWKNLSHKGQEVKIGLWSDLFAFLVNSKS
jgi:hypothetical protein